EVNGALGVGDPTPTVPTYGPPGGGASPKSAPATDWRTALATGSEWRVKAGPGKGDSADAVWFAFADVVVPEATAVEFTLTTAGPVEVWLNSKSLYKAEKPADNRPAPARFAGELAKGENRLLVQVGSSGAAAEF